MAFRHASRLLRLPKQLASVNHAEPSVCSHMHAVFMPLTNEMSACWPAAHLKRLPDRGIATSPKLAASIKVPSMGESVEEGTISAILKQQGDQVEMDEAIFQIETDKVTVDVRAPEAGVLDKVLVKADDTVRVGQELANVSAGGSGKADAPKQNEKPDQESKPQKESSKQPSQEDTTSKPATKVHSDTKDPHSSVEGQSESQPNADAGRVSIRFPRRRTPDGRRISDLPLEEQRQFHEQEAPQHGHPEAKEQQSAAKPQPQTPARQPLKPAASDPNKFIPYAGKERGTKLSQARVLSQREIDIIELGGAEP